MWIWVLHSFKALKDAYYIKLKNILKLRNEKYCIINVYDGLAVFSVSILMIFSNYIQENIIEPRGKLRVRPRQQVNTVIDSCSYSNASQQPVRYCFQVLFPFSWAYLEVRLQAEPWALRPPTTSFPKHHWLQNHIVTFLTLIRYPMNQMTNTHLCNNLKIHNTKYRKETLKIVFVSEHNLKF